MIEETMIKSHLIITDIHEEYDIKWLGKIKDTHPVLKDNKLQFIIIGGKRRIELNTNNIKDLEECAKRITNPRGRAAVTTDYASIYIKEENNKQTCIGVVTHNHIKKYAPMYDKVFYR